MKFARYLEDTQTPEWQRAYIDYRLLKKRITAIRRAMPEPTTMSPVASRGDLPGSLQVPEEPESLRRFSVSTKSHENMTNATNLNDSLPELAADGPSQQPQPRDLFQRSQTLPASINTNRSRPSLSHIISTSQTRIARSLSRRLTIFGGGQKPHPYSDLPLRELLPLLSPLELAFFTTLDAEVEKIEKFYVAREQDMALHTSMLEKQLQELEEHRKLFDAAYGSSAWASALNAGAILKLKAKILSDEASLSPAKHSKHKGKGAITGDSKANTPGASSSNLSLPEPLSADRQLDPDDFHDAKHKLRKAVMEHYRALEMLQNYRILNLTGIRKALKKFQKVTKISVQKTYISEKVDTTYFASDERVQAMMDRLETLYAIRFTQGDKKRALERLRLGPMHKTHHVSTFWAGLLIGLALPALASGLYFSYQQDTRNAIPGWDALLLVYGVFLIPVLFSLLVGLNVQVWSNTRINYVFIFEFDLRTRMDHREYFQIPSILFATLCGAFWLSFAQIGSLSPTLYPLIWLGFAAVLMFDPLPLVFKPSRWWLLRSIGKLLTSGTRPVEFADFWMGDQFCSLVFTLSNLCLVGCLYDDGFNSNWRQCGTSSRLWPLAFFLAILPFLIRFVQSIKRYADSGLITHLINGGKYFSGILAYLCYYMWRHRGGYGASFIAWCIVQTIYSLYAGSWDLFMDWSIFDLHERYPLLRKDLLYSSHVYENEQLGNRDQYRATREVPLPYSLALDERRADRDEERNTLKIPRHVWHQQCWCLVHSCVAQSATLQIPEWKRAYIDYRLFKERLRAIRQAAKIGDDLLYTVDSFTESTSQLGHSNNYRTHAGGGGAAGSVLSVIQSDSGEGSSEESFAMNMQMERRDLSFVHSHGPRPQQPQLRVDGQSAVITRPPPVAPDKRPSIHRTLTPKSNIAIRPPSAVDAPGPAAPIIRNPKLTLPQLIVRQATSRSHLAPPSPGGETVNTGGRAARISSNIVTRQWTNQSPTKPPASPGAVPPSPASRLKKNVSHMFDPLRKHPYAQLSMHSLIPLLSGQELAFFIALDEQVSKIEMFYQERQRAMKAKSRELELQLRELTAHRRRFDAAHSEPSTAAWANVLVPLAFAGDLVRSRFAPRPSSKPSTIDSKAREEIQEEIVFEGRFEPEKYLAAKRKLKKAVMEHHRALGMLNNYRILNIYAISRVLAKFEKTTKIPAQRAYMEEKVETTDFYTDDSLKSMMEELQNVYAVSFERGNRQKAAKRLRAGIQYKSHHNSTFCSGIAIGSALVAFGSGIAHVSEQSTRDQIAGWDGLLFIFGVFFVPVFFAVLIGLNLLVWSRNRINYTFIFELNLRTRLDHREYWLLPSVLLATLSYAFWLSFARIGAPTISPTLWPAVWLGCTTMLLVDPFPVLFKSSRYWLIKNTAKLLKSGLRRVEFSDFWLGDQFCSLSFPLSNIPLIVCVYVHGLSPEWRECGNSSNLWPLNFLLAILPFFVRFVQSVKRYADSKVQTHLVNAGKYAAGCFAQFWYIFWRHRGSPFDAVFALWVIFNTAYTVYALTWDLLMDWSLLRVHVRYKLLRKDLIYTHIWLYYFAIITNTILRFLWLLYIPAKGPDAMLRSFIVGFWEIVRRWQWNFYRLENEQIGNADQYRATREVPLPYMTRREVEDEDEDDASEEEKDG
uniref:Signal transduction protein n=1 Tax=Mycena chlorophos TaxID=658473 RepID=A0ABQ0LPA2_MYCCL|nr:signal transduction protein [Mycena chlorophos]